jgi:hypothetical protein
MDLFKPSSCPQGITLTSVGGVLLSVLVGLGLTTLVLASEAAWRKARASCDDQNRVRKIRIRPANEPCHWRSRKIHSFICNKATTLCTHWQDYVGLTTLNSEDHDTWIQSYDFLIYNFNASVVVSQSVVQSRRKCLFFLNALGYS